MTVSSTTNRKSYSGDGSTTGFAYDFKVFADSDLKVIMRDSSDVETVQTLTTHYSVSGVGLDAGGDVTMVTAPASGETLVIVRDVPNTQGTDYVENDPFPAASHEDALDKLTMEVQRLDEKLGRTPILKETSSLSDIEFPEPGALEVVRWNAAGTGLETTNTAFDWKGAWSGATAYTVDNAVVEDGSSYICILAHTNQQPPNATYWTQFAAKGDTGDPGAPGAGETNTASNVGTGGVGVFKQKTGVDLEFKKINAGSSKVTITDDTGDDKIDIDVAGLMAQGKFTTTIPAAYMNPRTSNGCAALDTLETSTNKANYRHLAFDEATAEYAQFEVAFPKSWDEGTIEYRVLWSHPSTSTNFDAIFTLAGKARADAEAMDAAFGTEVSLTDTGGATDTLYWTAWSGALTVASAASETGQIFQLKRDAADGSDTLAVDARIHAIQLRITLDQENDG
jgi:hypothetical protein